MLWERQAALLRHWLELPVLIGGNFHGLDEVEDVLARGSTDVVLMVRSLLSDPELLTKWLTGRGRDVQPLHRLQAVQVPQPWSAARLLSPQRGARRDSQAVAERREAA